MMHLYSAIATTGLTWLILIRPNDYTSASNAASWIVAMSVFVFTPMIMVELFAYRKELARKRRQNSARMHREMRTYHEHKVHPREISEKRNEEEITFTPAYNRKRFTRVHAA